MTDTVDAEETIPNGNGSSVRALAAKGSAAVATLFATVCGFFLTLEKPVALVVGVALLVITAAWIVWRELDRKSWLAILPASIIAFITFATAYSVPWYGVFRANSNLLHLGAGTVGGTSLGELAVSSIGRLVLLVIMAAICVLAAEGIHALVNRQSRIPIAAVHNAPIQTTSEVLKQVGTTEDGKPLYVTVAGPDVSRSNNRMPSTNTLAILALVFGLAGGLPAIPLGHIALNQIKRTGDSGRGMAIAGLVLGYAWFAFIVVYFIVVAVAISKFQ